MTTLTVDVLRAELDRWRAAAKAAGKPGVSAWARDVLNAATKSANRQVAPILSVR